MSNFRWEGTPDDNGTLWIGIEFPVNRTIRCAHWVESISHRASDFLVQARLQGREDWTAVWFEEGFDGSQGISVQW